MGRRVRSTVVTALLLVAALMPLGGNGSAAASGGAAIGLYPGPADVAGLQDFSTWLGSPITNAVDYADHRFTWNEIENPSWLMAPWSSWVNSAPGRRLALSVPLLPEGDRGRFAEGATGTFDVHFRNLARNLVDRGLGRSVIRLGWEMNNTDFPWYAGTDTAGYKAYFRRIVGVMRSVPGASFQFDWCPLAGIMAGSSLTSFDLFYPGDDVVDIIGLDNYDLKWRDTTSLPKVRWDFHLGRPLGLNDHRSFAIAHGKPMSFPEWGLYAPVDEYGGGGDNPFYIDRMAAWFAATPTIYQAYFNLDWGGGTLADFPNAQARYKANFGPASPTTTSTTAPPASTTSTTAAPGPWRTIDETEAALGPAGRWVRVASKAAIGGDHWRSTTSGDSAALTFTGTGARLTGAKGDNGGIAQVYLDGVRVAEVDTYAAARVDRQILFETTALAAGSHTLTVITTANRNPASTGVSLLLDDWQVRA